MVRGSYCEQVMTFFGLQITARLKLQFQSGTPFLKVWIRPCILKCLNSPLTSYAPVLLFSIP